MPLLAVRRPKASPATACTAGALPPQVVAALAPAYVLMAVVTPRGL